MKRFSPGLTCLAAFGWFAPVSSYAVAGNEGALPKGFVYLREADPSIIQDMRYATPHNFTGKPVPGYNAGECVLRRSAAEALKRAQEKAEKLGYSLKVYDCYRPADAVRAFVAWAGAPEDGRTKGYYPHLKKSKLVPNYIAPQSQHSTGTAVDLTLVPAGAAPQAPAGEAKDCTAPQREGDGSLDMGTAFDCFDPKATTASHLITPEERKNRETLKKILEGAGFKNYAAEWWHFSYSGEKSARRYDFPIEPRPEH
ncbi:MAG: M15 family metallopeptidase [Rhodomicrobium sp.]